MDTGSDSAEIINTSAVISVPVVQRPQQSVISECWDDYILPCPSVNHCVLVLVQLNLHAYV